MVHRGHHRQRRHHHIRGGRPAGGWRDSAAGLERRARRPWPQNHWPRHDRAPGPRPDQHGVLQEHPHQAARLTKGFSSHRRVKLPTAALVAACMAAVAPSARLSAQIDFQRDVQPIFREHCISCHGPDQQMSGLRLDRRADAMRGGSQSDIGPGSAEGSRLYHRLTDTVFGPQMPPDGPLNAAQIETIQQWIDEGAEWPDAVAGETPAPPADTDATRLMASIRDNDRPAPALSLLLDYGADPFVSRPTDPSPLREAARVDDAEMFRLLLEYGVSSKGADGAPAMFLRTNCPTCAALVGAGGPLPRRPSESAASSTAPRYDPGRAARPTPVGVMPATPASIRAAVERSLPLLQDVGVAFVRQTGCVSCHHNSVVSMTVAAARKNGYAVNEATAKQQASAIGADLESWRERTVQNMFIAGQADTISYVLLGLAADSYPPDAATDAQAIWLKRRQAPDGHWPVTAMRPPIESNDIEVTAVSMRALQVFAPPAQRAEYTKAVDRARAWLTDAQAKSTEERAFRLLGLSWAGAPNAVIKRAAADLLAIQRDDGGWAQDETMGSDAYATGEALVALRESGAVASTDRVYRKGVEFLLRTQIEDGSWIVESRAVPIQAYFESGFPYGVNQWVSAAATGWATTALALAK